AGEHDDVAVAQRGVAYELMAEHDAVHVRQPAVEDGEVPRNLHELAARLLAGREFDDVVSGAGEVEVNELADGAIVVDDRHPERLVGHRKALTANEVPPASRCRAL